MAFLLKKIISALLMPLPFGVLVLLLGWWAYRKGYEWLSKVLCGVVVVLWYFLAIYPVATMLAEPLEFRYPKYSASPVDYVVVLGGSHRSDEQLPLSSLLSEASMMRLSEGIGIYRDNPGSKLLLSGHQGRDVISNADAMSRVAQHQQVPVVDILTAPLAKDTAEEARVWADRLEGKSFALVTSAMHMPRAVFLFEQAGLVPISAPTHYKSGGSHALSWRDWLPNGNALHISESAWHEYLGMVWAVLTS